MNRVMALACLMCLIGCGDAPLQQSAYSPDRIASDALAKYDANKDGKIDAGELKSFPALAMSLTEIDTNGDKAIDAQELQARLKSYVDSKIALRDGVDLRIMRGSRGVPNVTVTLVPDECMGGVVKQATGISKDTGHIQFKTEGQDYPGVQPGIYKVTLSLKDASGKEMLPARFNTATIYGVEVAPSNRIFQSIDLDK